MEQNKIKDLQMSLLELMKVLHDVCIKYNIKYYMLGGTMLGAVRHKGFIPWDDDMDIGLERSDYDKLLSIPKSAWPSNIVIKTPRNSKDYIFPYCKLMNTNTTLIENRLNGIIEGIYIDIFPIDGAGNNWISAKYHYYKFYWKQGLLFNKQELERKNTFLRRLVQSYARTKNVNKLYEKVEQLMKKRKFEKSRIIGNFGGAWGLKELMYKEVMYPPKLYNFDDYRFYGPNDYDAYLNSLYGDYMKIPPPEKRKSHHDFLYLNLNQSFLEYNDMRNEKPALPTGDENND